MRWLYGSMIALALGCSTPDVNEEFSMEPQTAIVEEIVEKVAEKCPERVQSEESKKIDDLCMDIKDNEKRHQSLVKYVKDQCEQRERVKSMIGDGPLWVKKYGDCEYKILLERNCASRIQYLMEVLDMKGDPLHILVQESYAGYHPTNHTWKAYEEIPAQERIIPCPEKKVKKKHVLHIEYNSDKSKKKPKKKRKKRPCPPCDKKNDDVPTTAEVLMDMMKK
ncbi:hypothetical protein ACFL96_07435 [Thermoproteota archaeon]